MSNKAIEEVNVAEESAKVKEKPYTLRELCDEDIYPIVDILDKTLPEDIKDAFKQVLSGGEKIEAVGIMVGIDIARMVVKNIGKAKEEIYGFLSDLSGIPADQLKKLPFGTTPRMIFDLFGNVKNTDFFMAVSESL